jgi:uncharacterized protein
MKTASSKAIEAGNLHRRAHEKWDSGHLRSAFRLMRSAVQLGDSSAMLSLGYLYDCGIGIRKNRDLAMHWYKKAYRRGDSSAANNIGTIYRDEQKYRLALAWFEKAIALGDADANLEIAKLYLGVLDQPA